MLFEQLEAPTPASSAELSLGGLTIAKSSESQQERYVPHDLFNVIEQALRILSWQENLTNDEVPPRWMWHLDWEIEAWFQKVKVEREKKFGTNNTSSDDDGEVEGLFEENVYFERMKRGEPLFE